MSVLRVRPARPLRGTSSVPGDKSIAHRLLLLASIAEGGCEISGLPWSGDVGSTLACLARLLPESAPELQGWNSNPGVPADGGGFTSDAPRPRPSMRVPGRGRSRLAPDPGELDCGNSGTTMRLLLGLLAGAPGSATLTGDPSLSSRPMERVARPLRDMGARISTTEGHAPVAVAGGPLVGVRFEASVPSAQVKGALLLAGLAADGETEVLEPLPTRDHTERILHALGVIPAPAPKVRSAVVPAFRASVPGDASGAAFLACAALASGGSVDVVGVGVNPTRVGFLALLRRMGATVQASVESASLGEPVGTLDVRSGSRLGGIDVGADEVAAAIDEIPALAMLAALAQGSSRFRGVAELRLKESDRVAGLVEAIRALGGSAETDGEDLVVSGGGLGGGRVEPHGDHRIAMAAAAVAPGCRAAVEIAGAECAAISFPGFPQALRSLGADVEG